MVVVHNVDIDKVVAAEIVIDIDREEAVPTGGEVRHSQVDTARVAEAMFLKVEVGVKVMVVSKVMVAPVTLVRAVITEVTKRVLV